MRSPVSDVREKGTHAPPGALLSKVNADSRAFLPCIGLNLRRSVNVTAFASRQSPRRRVQKIAAECRIAVRRGDALRTVRRLTIVGGAVNAGSVAAGAGRLCAPAVAIGLKCQAPTPLS